MKVIIINGPARAGKDTFVTFCEQYSIRTFGRHTRFTSMVDGVKQIATSVGWEGEKTLESRKFLSDLKDALDSYLDFSYKDVQDYIKFHKRFYGEYITALFITARSPYDIERLKRDFNAYTICIRNPRISVDNASNHADKDVFEYEYDEYIENDGTLEDLEEKAKDFMERIMKDGPDY